MAFPATYNIAYYRGDQFDFVINPKNPNGTTFALDGYSALFIIASERGNPASFVAFGSASVNTALDNVTCKISPTVGNQLSGTSYVYDIQVSNSSTSAVYTLLTGDINITQDVKST
jgi:hypothetical protein